VHRSYLKVQIPIKLSDKVENVSLWIALIVKDVTQNFETSFQSLHIATWTH
jgi:hypothetical protein